MIRRTYLGASEQALKGRKGTKRDTPNEDFLWKVHGYTNEYIRFADTKAAFAVGISAALISGLFSSSIFNSLLLKPVRPWTVPQWIGILGLFALVLSISFGIAVVRPRLWNEVNVGFIFWDSVAGHGSSELFSKAINGLGESERILAISDHLFTLAVIAKRKYLYVNLCIFTGVAGSFLTGLALFLQHALK